MDSASFFAASRVIIVAGKGGVGKSTMSAALARAAAKAGLSTLLVRLTAGGAFGTLFGQPAPGTAETTLHAGGGPSGDADVRTCLITPNEALDDYLKDHGLGRITRRLTSTGTIEVVTAAAPGIRDLLVLGRVKALESSRAADLIVVDAPAAGHAVPFLQSPTGLRDAVGNGPIATQATGVLEMLADPARCRVLLVTLAEETPVNEVIETAFAIEDEIGVRLAPTIVNGLITQPSAFPADHAAAEFDISPELLSELRAANAFRSAWANSQHEQLNRLIQQLPLALIGVPQLPTTDLGPQELELLAQAITDGITELPDDTP